MPLQVVYVSDVSLENKRPAFSFEECKWIQQFEILIFLQACKEIHKEKCGHFLSTFVTLGHDHVLYKKRGEFHQK